MVFVLVFLAVIVGLALLIVVPNADNEALVRRLRRREYTALARHIYFH